MSKIYVLKSDAERGVVSIENHDEYVVKFQNLADDMGFLSGIKILTETLENGNSYFKIKIGRRDTVCFNVLEFRFLNLERYRHLWGEGFIVSNDFRLIDELCTRAVKGFIDKNTKGLHEILAEVETKHFFLHSLDEYISGKKDIESDILSLNVFDRNADKHLVRAKSKILAYCRENDLLDEKGNVDLFRKVKKLI